MFNHCKFDLEDLNTETIKGRRYYIISEDKKYQSITTVFSAFPKPELIQWRKKVGEENANEITRQATTRGVKIHSICEDYLNNKEIKDILPIHKQSFLKIKGHLNKINNIHGLEIALFSHQLKVGGRADCIAEYDNTLSVIDFKTSRKEKKEEWIQNYFLQATYYAMAYYEMTGIKIKQIVIIISVYDGESQVFIKNINNYVKPLISKIKSYYEIYHEEI